MGVTGGSYGGYMTNWIVGHTSRFKAAVTLRSISNFISDDGTRDGAYGHKDDFDGDIFVKHDLYWDRFAAQVRAECQDADPDSAFRQRFPRADRAGRAVVPRAQAFRRKTAEIVFFPRENHNLTRTGEPKHLVESLNWQLLLVRQVSRREEGRDRARLAVSRNLNPFGPMLQTTPAPGTPSILLIVPAVTATVTVMLALVNYARSNRIKAAELLLKVEENYRQQLPVLLRVEYESDFDKRYAPALKKVLAGLTPDKRNRAIASFRAQGMDQSAAKAAFETLTGSSTQIVRLAKSEGEAIDELEDAFRHFFTCYHIRQLGVDSRSMDSLCAYYLRVFWRRPLMRVYLAVYWAPLYYWAQYAGHPGPRRWLRQAKLIPGRLRYWWQRSAEPIAHLEHDDDDASGVIAPGSVPSIEGEVRTGVTRH